MREVIAVVLCLILFLIALQTGLLRTGLDFEAVVKQAENLQSANDRLAEEIKRLLGGSSPQGVSMTTTVLASDSGARASYEKTIAALRAVLAPHLQAEQVEWSGDRGPVRILLSDRFLLAGNGARVSAPGQTVLLAVAAALKGNNEIAVGVDGHAAPAKAGAQTSAVLAALREASWAHAKTVADFLTTTGGLEPVQVSVSGQGAFRPLGSNDSEAGRIRNRRVELILQPADALEMIQARQWVLINRQPVKKAAPKPEADDGEESIGEEALQDNDQDHFDAGYEHPAAK